jgi:hypothetical protein
LYPHSRSWFTTLLQGTIEALQPRSLGACCADTNARAALAMNLGCFEREQKGLQSRDNPFGTRLSPMS